MQYSFSNDILSGSFLHLISPSNEVEDSSQYGLGSVIVITSLMSEGKRELAIKGNDVTITTTNNTSENVWNVLKPSSFVVRPIPQNDSLYHEIVQFTQNKGIF
jgi:hypothetical protein